MPATIRTARSSDVDAILAIESVAFEADRMQRGTIRRFVDRPSVEVLVAEIGARIVGYCIVLFVAGKPVARLYVVAVAPDVTGQGIGRALIDAAETTAVRRGRLSLRLEVRPTNRRAIAIYGRAGYRAFGRKLRYYREGGDAIRLEKRLVGTEPGQIGRFVEKITFAMGELFSRLT